MEKIAIVGSGVVGRATGKGLIKRGHDVIFYDINPMVIQTLVGEELNACNIEGCVNDRNVFMLSVSTPTVNERIDLRFLESAVASVGKVIKERNDYSVVVIRSTVPPGTTEEILIPIIERVSGKKAGEHIGICMNPEYLREATAEEDFLNPRVISIGVLDHRTRKMMDGIYESFNVPIDVLSIREAELQKYVHNLWNATKISFFNEMRDVAKLAGVNPENIFRIVVKSAEASWNPSYGTKNLGPFGGSCLPKDTQALHSWMKDRFGRKLKLLGSVIKVNKIIVDQNGD